MKRNNFINYSITILIGITLILRLINKNIFNIYNMLINYLSIILIIGSSIYFSIKLKFLQFNILKLSKNIITSTKDDIKALFMSMGSKIGVGTIAGISLAIYISGPGVLLWIWIITILSSILTYCETYLGSKYKYHDNGGAFYYIQKGLNNKNLSIIYTIILILVYAIGFVGIQSNTILKSIEEVSNINKYVIIIITITIISIIIFNQVQYIINFISKIVPIMCLIYLVSGLLIILKINNIKEIFYLIITSGLNSNNTIWQIMIVGLQRGIFATESGIGTSSISTSISNSNPSKQGLFQVLGVHFISLIIITITGLLIISNSNNYIGSINGIEIVMSIFNSYYGKIGKIILCIIIILFAISTIISAYYFTLKGIEFIKNKITNLDYLLIKLFIIIFLLLGMIINSSLIWSIIDTLVLFLLIINIYTIIKLRKEIK